MSEPSGIGIFNTTKGGDPSGIAIQDPSLLCYNPSSDDDMSVEESRYRENIQDPSTKDAEKVDTKETPPATTISSPEDTKPIAAASVRSASFEEKPDGYDVEAPAEKLPPSAPPLSVAAISSSEDAKSNTVAAATVRSASFEEKPEGYDIEAPAEKLPPSAPPLVAEARSGSFEVKPEVDDDVEESAEEKSPFSVPPEKNPDYASFVDPPEIVAESAGLKTYDPNTGEIVPKQSIGNVSESFHFESANQNEGVEVDLLHLISEEKQGAGNLTPPHLQFNTSHSSVNQSRSGRDPPADPEGNVIQAKRNISEPYHTKGDQVLVEPEPAPAKESTASLPLEDKSVGGSMLTGTPAPNATPVVAELVDENKEAQERKQLELENRRYKKIIISVACLLVIVVAIVVGAILASSNSGGDDSNIAIQEIYRETLVPAVSTNAPTTWTSPSTDVLETISPTEAPTTKSPTASPTVAPVPQTLLKASVDLYIEAKLAGRESTATLEYGATLNDWDVSQIGDFSELFSADRNPLVTGFNEYIGDWDTSKAKTMNSMFEGAESFTGEGLNNWNVSGVTDMTFMFWEAKSFNTDLDSWETSRVESMRGMFAYASVFEGKGVEKWNVAQVTDMVAMFGGAPFFNVNLRNWNVLRVTDMFSMFEGDFSFQGLGLENWSVGRVTDMTNMFFQCANFNNTQLNSWDVSRVKTMNAMFYDCEIFSGAGLESWDTSQVTDMSLMFRGAKNLDMDLSEWDISEVVTSQAMFAYAEAFSGTGLENWDFGNVVNTTLMFYQASAFDANVATWDMSSAQNMYAMFAGAKAFRGIGLDSWDVGNVLDLRSLLCETPSITNSSIVSGWNITINVFDCE